MILYTDKNGKNRKRNADVVEMVGNTVTKVFQVGKSNQNGTPVIRERRAIRDILLSLQDQGLVDVIVEFISYNGKPTQQYGVGDMNNLNL